MYTFYILSFPCPAFIICVVCVYRSLFPNSPTSYHNHSPADDDGGSCTWPSFNSISILRPHNAPHIYKSTAFHSIRIPSFSCSIPIVESSILFISNIQDQLQLMNHGESPFDLSNRYRQKIINWTQIMSIYRSLPLSSAAQRPTIIQCVSKSVMTTSTSTTTNNEPWPHHNNSRPFRGISLLCGPGLSCP